MTRRDYRDGYIENARRVLGGSNDPLPPDKAHALCREVIALMTMYQANGWDWRIAVDYLIWKSRQDNE